MTSPTEKDVNRIAEILKNNYGAIIEDKDSFERAYRDYMGDNLLLDTDEGKNFSDKVFRRYSKFSIFERRKEQKREQLAPKVEVKRLEKVPIRKYGIAKRIPKKERFATKFIHAGKIRNRIVFARKMSINTRYGKQVRYIDNRGRYVGKIRKK